MSARDKIRKYINEQLDNDELSPEEAAFMIGYYDAY